MSIFKLSQNLRCRSSGHNTARRQSCNHVFPPHAHTLRVLPDWNARATQGYACATKHRTGEAGPKPQLPRTRGPGVREASRPRAQKAGPRAPENAEKIVCFLGPRRAAGLKKQAQEDQKMHPKLGAFSAPEKVLNFRARY